MNHAKGFAMVVYDYKFPTLATKLYFHYKKNKKQGLQPKGCKFNIINFVDVEYLRRVNPIQSKYINNLAAASEPTGVVRDHKGGNIVKPAYWLGKYSDMPHIHFHKIDRLIGTARSNKVSVTLGFQELPQLEADYSKVGMQKIITTVGNVVSGSARAKETLEWLSSDIFGKVVQLKKSVTIDRNKTSVNLNENMDSLVPASKISDMPTGWICGQAARDFVQTKVGVGSSMNIQESDEFKTSKFFCKTDFDMTEIKKEEAAYVPLPKFYTFKSRDERERILYKNFVQVGQDVKEMIADINNTKNAK